MEKVPTVQIAAPNPVTSTAAGVGGGEAASVPKWVIAAAIGIPVAAALAYILFGPSSDPGTKNTKKKKKKDEVKSSDIDSPVKGSTKPDVIPRANPEKDEVCLFYQKLSRMYYYVFRLLRWRM